MTDGIVTTEFHGGGTRETVRGERRDGERLVYSWVDGVPHVCTYRAGVRVVLRPAADADGEAVGNGGMSYDPETCPSGRAWKEHVRNGGD